MYVKADQVANTTEDLCKSTNMVVQGQFQESKLAEAAKAVALSTAKMLTCYQGDDKDRFKVQIIVYRLK